MSADVNPRSGGVTFVPGDRVRCTDPGDTSLTLGHEYVVTVGGTYTVAVEGVTSYQYARRFERVIPPGSSDAPMTGQDARAGENDAPDMDPERHAAIAAKVAAGEYATARDMLRKPYCPAHPDAGTGLIDPTGGDPWMGGPVLIRVCLVCGRECILPPGGDVQ